MYIQFKNGCVIDEVINYLKTHKEIKLPGVIINSPVSSLQKNEGMNNFSLDIKCDFISEVRKNYDIYEPKVFEYHFMTSANRISYNSETAGNVIKEIIGLVFR